MTRKEKAVHLIQNTKLTVKQIAKDTGLTQSWLYQLKNNEYRSEDKIDTLYNYLRRRK
jgi:transcriptional regulator with XRE-family HTH domain